jgi:formamidopyrimidine-DNA glycosylase
VPELPEMETYRKLLLQTVVNQRVKVARAHREKSINIPMTEFARRVEGRRIDNISRRGKHILFWLDSQDILLLHLMLGGWMYYGTTLDLPDHKSQVELTLENDHTLYFLGLHLGYLHLLDMPSLAERLSDMGPEPLDPAFTTDDLSTALKKKRGSLKSALIDQHCISGIGNRYSDEICFEAGILPFTRVPDLGANRITQLHDAIRTTLKRAISYGGYMAHPYQRADTQTGGYDAHFLVHDRENEPCPRCGNPITETEHAGRKLFYCSHCQH